MAEAVDEDIDDSYAKSLVIIEKELGGSAETKENSLLLKFFSQIHYLSEMHKEEEKQMKARNTRTLNG